MLQLHLVDGGPVLDALDGKLDALDALDGKCDAPVTRCTCSPGALD